MGRFHWAKILFTVWGDIIVDAKAAMPGPALDPEEAVLSPSGAPAVLHDPEVLAALRAVADRSDRVVVLLPAIGVGRLLATSGVLEDAIAVVEQVISL